MGSPESRELPAGAPGDLAAAVLGPVEVTVFENLYVAYHVDAQRLALHILRDPERAADAVHTAYLEMLRYLLSGRRWYDPGDARAVVLRNTRWAALNIARDRRRHSATSSEPAPEAVGDDDWARMEARAICEEIVRGLRVQEQEAIRLHFAEALSHADAGARLGISARAFEGRLYRALRSARRAARSSGVSPAVTLLAPLARRLGKTVHRGSRALLAQTAAAAAISAGLVASFDLLPATTPSAITTMQDVVVRDGIYQSVVVDVIAVPDTTMITLAKGARCHCWTLFRSDDGGGSWRQAPGPASVPAAARLGVASDGRLVIEDPAGHAYLVATEFGSPFQAGHGPLPPMIHVIHGARRGDLLAVDGRTPLSLAPGGAVCSGDRGVSWVRVGSATCAVLGME